MAVQKFPFTLYLRNGIYYVRFKNPDGGYLTATSTGKKDKDEAVKTAWSWYSQDKITRADQEQKLENKSLIENFRKSDLSSDDVDVILGTLKQRGLIKSYVKTGSKSDVVLCDYLTDFWTWEKSEYVKEKLRRGGSIGKTHVKRNFYCVKRYWRPYFKGRLLGELTRQDLRDFLSYLQDLDLSGSSKSQIWLAGAQGIRYAYNNEIIDRDITAGLAGFSRRSKHRLILTPEMAAAVFSVEWRDKRAYLANLLAMCTGLRAGEIRALQKRDIGRSCLYINHSWNALDGLKSTKNGEARIVQLPFPQITEKLLELADSNPFNDGLDAFVFYATIPGKPMEEHIFRESLHKALVKTGLPKEEAEKYCFHSWRHFYASYMRDLISEKLLQSQTGHKTLAMLEHYSNHKIVGDDEKVQTAQTQAFGDIVGHAHLEDFDKKELYHDVKTAYIDKSGMYEHSRQDR